MKKTFIIQSVPFMLVAMFLLGAAHFVFAGSLHSAQGWAWGGTESLSGAYKGIGWVSFNSLDCDTNGDLKIDNPSCGAVGSPIVSYGVNVPAGDGALSGYAWSEHYGWISFDAADLAGCAPALAGATRTGNSITGGARILSVPAAGVNAGGFDGCISLSGAGYGVTVVDPALSSLNGYAWSSDLGYLNFGGNGGNVTINTLADLSVVNVAPVNGYFSLTDPVTFQGTAINSAANTVPADLVWADLEIDWNSDGSYTSYNANAGAKLAAIAPNGSKNLTYTIPANPDQGGVHRYRFHVDTTNALAEPNENNNISNEVSFTIPDVVLNVSSCDIDFGESTCNAPVDWVFRNVRTPENYLVKNGVNTIGNTVTSGGSVITLFQYGLNTVTATANLVSQAVPRTIECREGSAWYKGLCFAAPNFDVTATPALIPYGDQTEVEVSVNNSVEPLECEILNATDAPITFSHVGGVNPIDHTKTYTYSSKNITAAQLVTVSCTHVASNQTTTKNARIEVIPKSEER